MVSLSRATQAWGSAAMQHREPGESAQGSHVTSSRDGVLFVGVQDEESDSSFWAPPFEDSRRNEGSI